MTDVEHLVLTVPRNRGELRLYRARRDGRNVSRIQIWYYGPDGEAKPSRSGVSVRDLELPEVIEALQRIQRRITRGAPQDREERRPTADETEGLF